MCKAAPRRVWSRHWGQRLESPINVNEYMTGTKINKSPLTGGENHGPRLHNKQMSPDSELNNSGNTQLPKRFRLCSFVHRNLRGFRLLHAASVQLR